MSDLQKPRHISTLPFSSFRALARVGSTPTTGPTGRRAALPGRAISGSEPVYSMTSSARASKAGGRLRPIALAVPRLITG